MVSIVFLLIVEACFCVLCLLLLMVVFSKFKRLPSWFLYAVGVPLLLIPLVNYLLGVVELDGVWNIVIQFALLRIGLFLVWCASLRLADKSCASLSGAT
ncbi:hypothetical protein [Dyella sp.]|uniref:hypothetical protein n=1 Tax=Dyella sp. TaxID=1869338 RepID=UPI002ED2376C